MQISVEDQDESPPRLTYTDEHLEKLVCHFVNYNNIE